MNGANELKDALASARDAITSATDRRSESRRRQEELIATALARGSTKKDIAAAAGISRAWFYKADLAPNTPAVGRTPLPVTDEQQSTLDELVALRGDIEDLDDVLKQERACRLNLVRDLAQHSVITVDELVSLSGLSAESLRGILGGKLKKRLAGKVQGRH